MKQRKPKQIPSPPPAPVLTSLPSQKSLAEEARHGQRRASSPGLPAAAGRPLPSQLRGLLPLLWARPRHASREGGTFSQPRRGGAPSTCQVALANFLGPGPPGPSPNSQTEGSSLIPCECRRAALPPDPDTPGRCPSPGSPLPWLLSSFCAPT